MASRAHHCDSHQPVGATISSIDAGPHEPCAFNHRRRVLGQRSLDPPAPFDRVGGREEGLFNARHREDQGLACREVSGVERILAGDSHPGRIQR